MATKKAAQKRASKRTSDSRAYPTLQELFTYERDKRSTLEGITLAARGGDRQALKKFAAAAVVSAESATALPEIRNWLIDALCQIEAGIEPNVAFGWKRRRPGHPSPRQDFEGLKKTWLLGHQTAGLVAAARERAPDKPPSMRKIFAVVAKDQHASVEQVRAAWDWWIGEKRVAPE